MIIYRYIDGVKTILHDLEVDSQTELRQSISGEDLIMCRYISEGVKLDLQIGDFTEFKDSVYQILDEPNVKKSQNTFTYNLQFKSDQYILKNVQVMNPEMEESEFFLFGNAIDMVSLIISNLNRVYSDGAYYADYVEQTESKNIGFNNENCLAALQRLATEFGCEFTVKGKKITFRKQIGTETDLVFQYKKNLRDIERQTLPNAELLTVLYAYGSRRNITNEYGSQRLRLSKIEKNVEIFGTIERSVTFDDIYPRFRGSVSSSSSMAFFTDTGIDFDINAQLMGGMKAKVVFNTGDLAGREFEILSYNHSTKTVELKHYTDDTDLRLPNETFRPRVGDKYVFINIKMPQTYIDNAEAELLEKATEYLDKYSQPNVIYKIAPHHPALRDNDTHLNIGDIITIQDDDFGIEFQTRILNLTQKRHNQYEYSLDVGNQVTVNYFTQVMSDTKDIRNNIYLNDRYYLEQFNRVFNNIQGFTAPLYVNRGEFNPANYYYNNQNRVDYVFKYDINGKKFWYFYRGQDHARAEWIEANWELIGSQFEILATQTLLAENANIGHWIIQNGMIVSQAIYDSSVESEREPRVQLNGREGYIKLVSPVNIYTNAGYRTYKQTILIDSRTGSITISRSGDEFQEAASTSITSNGVSATFPGQDTHVPEILPTNIGATSDLRGLGIMVAVGKGKLQNAWYGTYQFLAGVVGRVVNSTVNNSLAPAFGGVFWSLKSFGRNVGLQVLYSHETDYTCHIYDEFISCYNSARLELKLPSDPVLGRKIEVRRNAGEVKVTCPGIPFIRRSQEDNVFIIEGDCWTFIYDGKYWLANHKGRL